MKKRIPKINLPKEKYIIKRKTSNTNIIGKKVFHVIEPYLQIKYIIGALVGYLITKNIWGAVLGYSVAYIVLN